jgi:hypothetical protein
MTWHAAATLDSRNAEGAPLRTIAFVPNPAGQPTTAWRQSARPSAPSSWPLLARVCTSAPLGPMGLKAEGSARRPTATIERPADTDRRKRGLSEGSIWARPTAARWWREYSGSGLAIVAKRVRANFSQMSYKNTAIGAAPLGCGRAGLANHLGPGLRAWPRDRMQDTCREPSRDCSSPTPGISAALVTSTESTRLGFSTSRVQTRQLERTVYGRPVVAVAPRVPRPSKRQAANPGTQRARRRARGHHRRPRRRPRVKPVGARPSQTTN